MNDSIISADYKTLRIWNKKTYKCVKPLQHPYCNDNNGLSKLKDNTIILGSGYGILFIYDVLSFQDDRLGNILSILVMREDEILIGNSQGQIICYNSLYGLIIFTQKLHTDIVTCMIKTEDNKILSSSFDGIINIMTIACLSD